MKKRIITAAVLVPILMIVLYALPKVVAAIVVSLLSAIAAYELLYRTELVKHVRLVAYSVLIAAFLPLWSYFSWGSAIGQAAILAFFGLLFMEMMISQMKLRIEKVALCILGGLFVPYLFSSLIRVLTPDGGRYVILIPFVLAFLSDTGAYLLVAGLASISWLPSLAPRKVLRVCSAVSVLLWSVCCCTAC